MLGQDKSPSSAGWKRERLIPSLQENFKTVPIATHWPWWRKMFAFAGPGYVVAVGYMDPGNWATDLAAGSAFNYSLLSIVFISNIMAIILQHLAAKLGMVTGRDLAQACRDHFSKPVTLFLWFICEIAIAACDLAEVIGAAVALKLLLGIPLLMGVCITALDVLILLHFQKWHIRYIELLVIILMSVIAFCFAGEIFLAKPALIPLLKGFIPSSAIIFNHDMLYIAIGIVGATVMPHNLYLHSSVVQTRHYASDNHHQREALKFVSLDTAIALTAAFFINAAILIVAASVFYAHGYRQVNDIEQAYQLLTPLLKAPLASTLFALALLASGQNSTLTGTLAGQIVMEGFLDIRFPAWLRRLLTRSLALVPALICVAFYGEKGVGSLLLFSQMILSFQLAFAVVPLIIFTSDKRKMGQWVNKLWLSSLSWLCALIIIGLNIKYIFDVVIN